MVEPTIETESTTQNKAIENEQLQGSPNLMMNFNVGDDGPFIHDGLGGDIVEAWENFMVDTINGEPTMDVEPTDDTRQRLIDFMVESSDSEPRADTKGALACDSESSYYHKEAGCLPYRQEGEECQMTVSPGFQHRCSPELECRGHGKIGGSGTCAVAEGALACDSESSYYHKEAGCLPYRQEGEECQTTVSPGFQHRCSPELECHGHGKIGGSGTCAVADADVMFMKESLPLIGGFVSDAVNEICSEDVTGDLESAAGAMQEKLEAWKKHFVEEHADMIDMVKNVVL